MKNKIKSYLILFFTGWRSIKHLGNPKENMGTYLVCLKNNAVMEYNYSIYHTPRWFKVSVGEETITNPIIFWKPLPKSPYTKTYIKK